MMDFRVRTLGSYADWRTLYRFGFYHYGVDRVFRIGKLCIRLWRVS